jgi:ArsR family transcriptional regulator
MAVDRERDAELFKALADPNRLRILDLLKRGEECACVLLSRLEIGQPTLSHHMAVLKAAGLVKARADGKWTWYALDARGSERARRMAETWSEAAGEARPRSASKKAACAGEAACQGRGVRGPRGDAR